MRMVPVGSLIQSSPYGLGGTVEQRRDFRRGGAFAKVLGPDVRLTGAVVAVVEPCNKRKRHIMLERDPLTDDSIEIVHLVVIAVRVICGLTIRP